MTNTQPTTYRQRRRTRGTVNQADRVTLGMLRLPKGDADRLRALAVQMQTSCAALVECALRQFVLSAPTN